MTDTTESELRDLKGPEQQLAAARSRAYKVFAETFEYPDEAFCELIRNGALLESLRAVLSSIDPGLAGALDGEALRDPGGEDDLAVEYTRLFDVGTGGPPCPLYGGLYGGARMKTMEEAVRFYNYFGLSLSEEQRELPDHITTQLEFLHFLAYRETEALQAEGDADSFRRAQRDFIDRAPGKWVPKLQGRMQGQKPMRFFTALVDALVRFLANDRARVVALVGSAPPPSQDPSRSTNRGA
jgi:DMSO reductase family type II enzyme chaperone